jgi:5-methylthioadenosine/S-adenosylhomocysteine deaminase
VRDGTQLAIVEMLRGGTTCFNDMYFFPDVIAQAARACGMRAVVGLIVIDFPSAWAQDAADYLAKGLALHDALQDDPLIHCALAPHAPYTVNDSTLERIRDLAAERALPIHMHVHETASEVAQWLQNRGCRPLAHLDRLGLLSPRLAAVHMTQLLDPEIERIAAAGVHVLHCPESNLKLASGFCPSAKLLAAGVNVAIGTDGAASNNDLDMFGELRMAALLGKAVAADAAALPAYTALRMATLNGARALGLGDQIGSLEPGKQADLIAVDLAQPESVPMYHLLSQLVYATARQQVSDVWVAGKRLLENHTLTTLAMDDIVARAQAWRQRIGN